MDRDKGPGTPRFSTSQNPPGSVIQERVQALRKQIEAQHCQLKKISDEKEILCWKAFAIGDDTKRVKRELALFKVNVDKLITGLGGPVGIKSEYGVAVGGSPISEVKSKQLGDQLQKMRLECNKIFQDLKVDTVRTRDDGKAIREMVKSIMERCPQLKPEGSFQLNSGSGCAMGASSSLSNIVDTIAEHSEQGSEES